MKYGMSTFVFIFCVGTYSSLFSMKRENSFEQKLFSSGVPGAAAAPAEPEEELKIPRVHKLVEKNESAGLRIYLASLSDEQRTAQLCQIYKRFAPVTKAAHLGYDNCLKVLLENGAPFNKGDCSDKVQDFLAEDPSSQDIEHGVVPIHRAVLGDTPGHTACIDLLCRYNARVDSRCIDGDTPLHTAVWQNKHAHIHVLIMHGADYLLPNRSEKLPLDSATPVNRAACAAVIFLSLLERAIPRSNMIRLSIGDKLLGDLKDIVIDYALS